jgi:hypothetical protein
MDTLDFKSIEIHTRKALSFLMEEDNIYQDS